VGSNRIPDFRPSSSGFHFANAFRHEPVLVFGLGGIKLPIGDASRGLCGGMVFAVRDLFEARMPPPPDTDAPRRGSPLFGYLVRRLFASFALPMGPLRYMLWMVLPSGSLLGLPGLAMRTARAWPRIKRELDEGRLAPLGLVRARSLSPFKLARNHQVLAYGYDLDEATGRLSILVYDPNHPDHDQLALMLRLGRRRLDGHIQYVQDERAVRGFFLTLYRAADPRPSLAGGLI
jgi:hypothetical protein